MRSRLFVALWPDDDWCRQASEIQKFLPPDCRKIPSENFHVTLAFLGDVDDSLLTELQLLLQRQQTKSFALQFRKLVHWRGDVAVLLPDEDVGLLNFVRQLHEDLRLAGFVLEPRPYKPHVTLARSCPEFCPQEISLPEWLVHEWVLVRSTLLPQGSRYDILRRYPVTKSQ